MKKSGVLLFALVSFVFAFSFVSAWGTTCMRTQPTLNWTANYNPVTQNFTISFEATYCLQNDTIYGYLGCGEKLDYAMHSINANFCWTLSNGAGGTGNNVWVYDCVGNVSKCCGGAANYQACVDSINGDWAGKWDYICHSKTVNIDYCTGNNVKSANFVKTVFTPFLSAQTLPECSTASPYNGKGYKINTRQVNISADVMKDQIVAAYSFYHGDDTHCERTRVTKLGVAKIPDCNYDNITGLFSGECCSDPRFTGLNCGVSAVPENNCSSLDQTIMKISFSENAYAALWNKTGQSITTCSSGVTAYWNFDETSGSEIIDSSNNGRDGSCSGSTCPSHDSSGKLDSAYSFDGVDDYFNIGSDIIGAGATTICAWVYPTAWSGGRGMKIVSNGQTWLYLNSFNLPQHSLGIVSNGNVSGFCISSQDSIVLNAWQFVCASRDSAGVPRLYINGTYSNSNCNYGAPIAGGSVKIGNADTSTYGNFSGKIDEVSIFNRVLSDAEIFGLYNAGIGRKTCTTYVNVAYNYPLCYDEIFNYSYVGTTQVHDCTVKRPFLWLSNESGSKVSINGSLSDPVYNVPVCYGNLSCVYESDASISCADPNYRVVARLNSTTNSNISNSLDTGFPVKVCCGVSVLNVGTGNANWKDMNSAIISSANKYDTVKMSLLGTGLSGLPVSFKVYQESDSWLGSDDLVYNITINSQLDTEAAAYWTTSDAGTYYFVAEVAGNSTPSGELTVVNSISNSPINITIIRPSCGFIGNTSTNVGVEVSIVDVDDLVEGYIDFGDGQRANVSNNQSSYVFSQNYTQAGSYKILVNASDRRGNWRVIDVNIIIIKLGTAGLFLASCISEPADYANIPGSSAFFSAASTVAVDYSGTVMTKIMPGDSGSSRLYFQWSFNGVADNEGPFLGNETTAYNFTKVFAQSGHNWADVVINFN